MDGDLSEILTALKALGLDVQSGGAKLLTVVLGIIGLVRVWRSDPAQRLITGALARIGAVRPNVANNLAWLVWANLSGIAKWSVPVGLAVLTAAAAYLQGSITWQSAVVGAVLAAAASVAGHWLTKGTGHLLAPATNAVIGVLPTKAQGTVREIVSVALPTPAPAPRASP